MDEPTFELFYRAMFPRLVAYAMTRMDASAAQDVAAATLETLWYKQIPTPSTPDELDRLERLAYHVCWGHLRNVRRADMRRSALTMKIALQLELPESAFADTDEPVEWLGRLAVKDQEVLTLAAAGYHLKEIAVMMDCGEETAKKRLHRARRRARAVIEAVRGPR